MHFKMDFHSISHNHLVLLISLVLLFSTVVPGSLVNALIRDDDTDQIILPVKSEKALNSIVIQGEPIQKSATCKFGRAIRRTCKCPASVREPICGSDLENYANFCEFQCAFKCNPRLVPFNGECPMDGGPPKRPKLNFTKKKGEDIEHKDEKEEERKDEGEKSLVKTESPSNPDYDELPLLPTGQLSRSLGGVSMDEYLPRVDK